MYIKRVILFLFLNFAALGIGGFFTGSGVSSDWYQNLLKAPWTPPGWVFGFAWTSIMICFAFYMSKLYEMASNKKTIIGLFAIQWILNVAWNPFFFYLNQVTAGLLIITSLTGIVSYFLFKYAQLVKWNSILILPYLLWLLIASSLNAYILLYN